MNSLRKAAAAAMITVFSICTVCAQSVNALLDRQDELIDTVTEQILQMRSRIVSLSLQVSEDEKENGKLLEEISETEKEVSAMKENIESLKTALSSNKEDTSNMIGLFSGALEDIDGLEEDIALLKQQVEAKNSQLEHASLFFNIAVPVMGTIGLIPCIKLLTDGDDTGGWMMAADLGCVLALELTWNIGRGLEARIPTLKLW